MSDPVEFFIAGGESRRGELVLRPEDAPLADPFALIAGDIRPTVRLFRRASGRREYDFLTATDLTSLMAQRVVDALRDHGISGWASYPTEISPPIATAYFGLVVTGRCAIDHSRSIYSDDGPMGREAPVGLVPDERSWDGSDISLVPGSAVVVVTERVWDLARSERWTNVKLTPAAKAANFFLWKPAES